MIGAANLRTLRSILQNEIAELYPGYFALVMATGIVSIAAYLLEMPSIAWGLLWINVVSYGILWLLILLRLLWYYPRMMRDLADHARGPGYFTLVASTCVLGTQLIVLAGASYAGTILWALGLSLWVILMYGFFTAIIVRAEKPFLADGINGAWLIAIVATQSVSILGTLIADVFAPWNDVLLFFTLSMYLFGCMLYIITITLIFYRMTFFRIEPEQLTPPYWINMGAVAITTLAGATLMLAAPQWEFLTEITPFLKGFTLFFWATGTWWIPLLFLLGAWRHLYRRFPFRYDPQYWGMVFPLGMYATCTFQLARAADLELLFPLARGFVYLALAAWGAVFIGLLHRLTTTLGGGRMRTVAAGNAEDIRNPINYMTVQVHCPVHEVDAEVRLSTGLGNRPERVEECSLFPRRRGDVPCEAYCVTTKHERRATSTGQRSGEEESSE